MSEPDLAEAIAALKETMTRLAEYIDTRAAELAAPRIAAAERTAAERIGQVEAAAIAAEARHEALAAELCRQLDVAHRQVARLRWAARYLPRPLRSLVLAEPSTPGGWAGERPDERFAHALDQAARSLGLAHPRGGGTATDA